MPVFKRSDVHLVYEVFGRGYPVLALAPGGMRSRMERWNSPIFKDPRHCLADDYTVITLDQRNAGQSRARVTAEDGWHSYRDDHLALLDHLGVARCHILGACIGVSFALRLCQDVPERVSAAVLQNPIGLVPGNRPVVDKLFSDWQAELTDRTDIDRSQLPFFQTRMFGGNFIFSVTQEAVSRCAVPLLLLPGQDDIHPAAISADIAVLAPQIETIPDWKGPAMLDATAEQVKQFLKGHTSQPEP